MLFDGFQINGYPLFQVWRPTLLDPTTYNKTGEIQMLPDQVETFDGIFQIANITLNGSNKIEIRSGDVVGYYHPPDALFRVRTIQTDGYILYQFSGLLQSLNLSKNIGNDDNRQPLIQFTIGELTLILFQSITYIVICIWCICN